MARERMIYERPLGLAMLVFTVILLAACSRLLRPRPSTGVVPSPSTTSAGKQSHERTVCRVFIASYEERLGGMPGLVNTVYISDEGLVQRTLERTDDLILSLREGKQDVLEVLGVASGIVFPEPSPTATPSSPGMVVLPEYSGPTLLVQVAFCGGSSETWVGSPDDAPDVFVNLVSAAEKLGEEAPLRAVQPGQMYIRSQILSLEKTEQLRRAGIVTDVDQQQLASAPLLESALMHERRLIAVPEAAGLYGTIPLLFVYGRSAHIGYDGQTFQVRHMLAGDQ